MQQVSLERLEFFAYHGFYKAERQKGNRFEVDITVDLDFSKASQRDSIHGTVNYQTLYEIVKEEMEIKSKLLENVAMRIIRRVFDEFTQVQVVEVSVSKFNPPLGGICERSRIRIREERNG